MQSNVFKAQLLARRQQIGVWSMLASSHVAEVLSQSHYDWILLDSEHAPNEVPMVLEQLRAVAQSGMPAIVRPSANDPVQIKRLLDIGAQTLLIPMVDTAIQANAAVAAVRYPPHGVRGVSMAPRANRYGRDADYLHQANEEVCLLVQLETPAALRNLESIAHVAGIDGLFIGPSDLAATLGHIGNVHHREVQAAIDSALDRAKRSDMPIGILMTDPVLAASYLERGFDYVAVATDIGMLRAGAEAALKHAHAASRQHRTEDQKTSHGTHH